MPRGGRRRSDKKAHGGPDNEPARSSASMFNRTKMCKFYALGACTKGAFCSFAHQKGALQPLPNLFKTKMCAMLQEIGQCQDENCRYAHGRDEMRTLAGPGIRQRKISYGASPKSSPGSGSGEGVERRFTESTICSSGLTSQLAAPDDTLQSTALTLPLLHRQVSPLEQEHCEERQTQGDDSVRRLGEFMEEVMGQSVSVTVQNTFLTFDVPSDQSSPTCTSPLRRIRSLPD